MATETHYGESYNGVYNHKLLYTYEYDNKGRIDTKVLEVYRYEDGPLTGVTVSEYKYDKRGHLKKIIDSKDVDGDRVSDTQDIYKFTYDRSGTLIKEVRDYGNDDIIDYEYTRSPLDPGSAPPDCSLLV